MDIYIIQVLANTYALTYTVQSTKFISPTKFLNFINYLRNICSSVRGPMNKTPTPKKTWSFYNTRTPFLQILNKKINSGKSCGNIQNFTIS